MNIIFLDIDGVLNGASTKEKTPSGYCFVEDEKIEILKQIIEEGDYQVVLSSTWRQGFYDIMRKEENTTMARDYLLLMDRLKLHGITIMGHTREDMFYGHRGSDISHWIKTWTGEKIEHILIVDDDRVQPYNRYAVRTYYRDGLFPEHIEYAREILKKEFVENEV